MEKFKIYSNDPYDFNDINQILEFYQLVGNKGVANKITDENRNKIFLKIVVDKSDDNVAVSLIQNRKGESTKVKLPDLVIEYAEYTVAEAEAFIDLSEYTEFDL